MTRSGASTEEGGVDATGVQIGSGGGKTERIP